MGRSGPPRRPPQPELIWDGKYDAEGRRQITPVPDPLPTLHTVERYGEQVSSSGWRNRLILGENRLALHALLEEFRGQVQLIYIDPPFEVGSDFQLALRNPDSAGTVQRGLAYRDKWGQGERSYLQVMYERLLLLRELLRDTGCLFLHCDWHNSASLRLMLDEVFGRDRFVNEIVWHYYNKYSGGKANLPRAHDTILLYAKSPGFAVNSLRLPRDTPQRQLVRKAEKGVLKNAKGPDGKVLYRIVTDKKADDVWDIPQLQPASPHWTGYGTQKHHDLLSRIIALGSQPGDLVLDAFCGSGTTLVAAETLNRRWIGCDLGLPAVHIARRRLWSVKHGGLVAFDVYTLGDTEHAEFLKAFPAANTFRAHLRSRLVPPADTDDRSNGYHFEVTSERGIATLDHVSNAIQRMDPTTGKLLICAAWDFEPGIWQKLDGTEWSDRVRLVLLPRTWLGPADGLDAPCVPLPRIAATARATSGDEIEVALTDRMIPTLHPDSGKDAPTSTQRLKGVDAWAVHSGWEHGRAFAPQAHAFRGKRRPLTTRLTVPHATRGEILIKAWDGFGVEGTVVLALPSRSDARGKAKGNR